MSLLQLGFISFFQAFPHRRLQLQIFGLLAGAGGLVGSAFVTEVGDAIHCSVSNGACADRTTSALATGLEPWMRLSLQLLYVASVKCSSTPPG
jgi:hypothetical protein